MPASRLLSSPMIPTMPIRASAMPRHAPGAPRRPGVPDPMREAWLKLVSDLLKGGDGQLWFSTMTYHDNQPALPVLQGDFKHWRNRVHRSVLGPKWSKRRDQHMTGVLTTEGLFTDNIHTHALFRFHHRTPAAFPIVCASDFNELTDGRGHCLVKLASEADVNTLSSYMMKWTGVPSHRELITFFPDH
jgi:hypothetical protein